MPDSSASGPTNLADLREWLAKLRLQDVPSDPRGKTTASPAPQEPLGSETTVVVAPKGPADYTNLTDATRKAPSGARLLIRPGRYEEGVVLDRPLELIGDGP